MIMTIHSGADFELFQMEEKWKERKEKRGERREERTKDKIRFVDFRRKLEHQINLKIRVDSSFSLVTKLSNIYPPVPNTHLRNDCITDMNSRHLFRTCTPIETQIPNKKVRIIEFH